MSLNPRILAGLALALAVMRRLPLVPLLYCTWSAVSIMIALVLAGPTPDSFTRILVLLFLYAQWATQPILPRLLPHASPRTRFIAMGASLSVVVEGCHMFSNPVFSSLRISPDTSIVLGLYYYGIDLLFTLPAYLVIFRVIWLFLERLFFPFWHYVFIVSFAQVLVDGGFFYFLGSPAMLIFLPYPMTNYHAINVLPYLLVRDQLPSGLIPSTRIYLVIPAVFATYFVCGALIHLLWEAWLSSSIGVH